MDKKIHQIKCEGCGSKIDPNKMYCEYCSPKPMEANNLDSKQKPVLTDDMINNILVANMYKKPILHIVIFLMLWCAATAWLFVTGVQFDVDHLKVISPFAGMFGILLFLFIIKKRKEFNLVAVRNFYEQKKYKKALQLLQQKLKTCKNIKIKEKIITQLILLSYYKFYNIAEVKEYIFSMQTINRELPLYVKRISDELKINEKWNI